ncbi:MAG: type II toxin-antitoxin system HicA family toxin [Fimbriimonadales bacterium]|nr:type II toxin-antitoxin system HicA family toxin [Fimbriimonadales bacterium]
MAKLTPIPAREVIRKLHKLGFEGPYGGGKHPVMRHPETGVKISVPAHANRDLPKGTLRSIVDAAGVRVEEWEAL